jgi:hypothetical protein
MLLGVLAFWLGMSIAILRFPAEYDWRYMTISMLVYPERNPVGHLWASAGLALCALCGLLWSSVMIRSGFKGIGILAFGYLCMVCSSLLPERLIHVPRGHEILAITAFICICTGLLRVALQHAAHSRRSRSRAFVLCVVPLTPIVLAAMTQTYLGVERPELPWVGLVWRERGIPLFLSFALWEWITCVALSIYMASLGWIVTSSARNLKLG